MSDTIESTQATVSPPVESTPTVSKRLVGTPTTRTCVDCHLEKDRFKDFRPRKSRCNDHRGKANATAAETCSACTALRNSLTRQPRCTACDGARGKAKSAAKAKPVKVKAVKAPKKAKKAGAATVTAPAPDGANLTSGAQSQEDKILALVDTPAPPVTVTTADLTPVVADQPVVAPQAADGPPF